MKQFIQICKEEAVGVQVVDTKWRRIGTSKNGLFREIIKILDKSR